MKRALGNRGLSEFPFEELIALCLVFLGPDAIPALTLLRQIPWRPLPLPV